MSGGTKLILDLGKTCRTCLEQKSTEELRSLLENNLEKVLCEIANIQLNFHSSLPTSICTTCLKTLNLVLDFRNQVQETEAQLRKLIHSADKTCSNLIAPMTVIFKSFAVLENTEFSDKCEKNIEITNENKYETCEEVLLIESTENELACFQNTSKESDEKNVLKSAVNDNKKIYAVCEEFADTEDVIAYFVSDDEDDEKSNNSVKNKQPETLNINKSTIFINGNISNVIKWADSENNSISLSNTFIETNQKETSNQKEVLAGEAFTDSDNNKYTKHKEILETENKLMEVEKMEVGGTVKKTANFSCNLCAKKFRYEFGYRAHLTKHGISMVCKLCRGVFNDTSSYLAHTKSNHPNFKPFACPHCDKNFAVMSTLKKHYMYHTVHIKPRKFACDVCNKKFSQHNFLMAHKRSHSGGNPYECDMCNKNFSSAHSLRNHQKIHRGEKKHKCDICEARFIHRFSLRAHIRTHSGEKPFLCKLCNNKFSTSSYLKIHMRTHTSEKPYRCPCCEKNFVSRCALAAHEKSHTGEKKFQCDVCGWRSTRLADLQTHIRSHTGEKPYFCDQCDKSYKTSSNLAAHKRTHLGLREHICHICNKAFGDPRTLKCHIRVHTGETPYQCHICGTRFKQSGQLSAHRKTHKN